MRLFKAGDSNLPTDAPMSQAGWVGFVWGLENSLGNSEFPADHLEPAVVFFCQY